VGTPYLGEVKIISFNFAPKGWALCNGQLMAINTNQALFSILGTVYGGDGRTTFGLPDLRSRVPVYQGQGLVLGQKGGEENHTLTTQEMAAHVHTAMGTTNAADSAIPATRVLGQSAPDAFKLYSTNSGALVPLHLGSIGLTGGNQAHANIQPYLALYFIIALQGVFPSRN
jgi:microcystin-dependent protein